MQGLKAQRSLTFFLISSSSHCRIILLATYILHNAFSRRWSVYYQQHWDLKDNNTAKGNQIQGFAKNVALTAL
jgi:hypothetical protein